jgi:hypothetical protein
MKPGRHRFCLRNLRRKGYDLKAFRGSDTALPYGVHSGQGGMFEAMVVILCRPWPGVLGNVPCARTRSHIAVTWQTAEFAGWVCIDPTASLAYCSSRDELYPRSVKAMLVILCDAALARSAWQRAWRVDNVAASRRLAGELRKEIMRGPPAWVARPQI